MRKELTLEQEIKDNKIVELKDEELSTISGGIECVHSVQPLDGTEEPKELIPDIVSTPVGILQQAAQAMLVQANTNAANTLGLLK